jgi:hypothetical protein
MVNIWTLDGKYVRANGEGRYGFTLFDEPDRGCTFLMPAVVVFKPTVQGIMSCVHLALEMFPDVAQTGDCFPTVELPADKLKFVPQG